MRTYNYFKEEQYEIKYTQKCYMPPYDEDRSVMAFGMKVGEAMINGKYSNDIIKWGFRKNCKVKIPKISNCSSQLILHKQRFYCKHCNNTFIAETSLVDKYKNNPKMMITHIYNYT